MAWNICTKSTPRSFQSRCPLLAQSGHALVPRTCPLLGAKRTWPNRPGIYPLHDLSFSIVARLTCGRFYKRALADRFCLRIKCDFNHIRVRSFILTGAPLSTHLRTPSLAVSASHDGSFEHVLAAF